MTTYGEMFAGYGGLGMGVQSVLGGEMAWCAEFDAAPSKILAHHWPDVPNLGDVTKVDWATMPKVDVITGGSPCQDLSHAGKRAGMTTGTRSNLWAEMREAIAVIRPRLVVWENVRGAYSACADSEMGRCPRCVGGDPDVGHTPFLRALGRVLGDFSSLGYDTWWYGLRAADVGAPHGRFRVFVFAHPAGDQGWIRNRDGESVADAELLGHEWAGTARGRRPGPEDNGLAPADADEQRGRKGVELTGSRRKESDGSGVSDECGSRPDAPADASGDGWDEGRPEPAGLVRGSDAALSGHTPPADTDQSGRGRVSELDSRQAAGVDGEHRGHPDGRHDGAGRGESQSSTDWGQYAPAIHRWERVLGRVAPAPTETGPKGGQRLSPRFCEWMMGLPEGHVTDPAIGISRNDQLKALGNGVVPQQAAAATRMWLAHIQSEHAA